MKRFINPRFVCATLFCVLVWAWVAMLSVKLADIYDQRGDAGFRHALAERLDHRFDAVRLIATGVGGLN